MDHLCQDCNRIATHAQPQVCDRCWAKKNSTQYMNGEYLSYAKFFPTTMKKGMGKKPDESREEWFKRNEVYIRGGGYAKSVIKSKGKKTATNHSDDDP